MTDAAAFIKDKLLPELGALYQGKSPYMTILSRGQFLQVIDFIEDHRAEWDDATEPQS